MASRKQIQANRKNAQKSTGPNTPGGKANSSRNSLKHGVLSQRAVDDHEDKEACRFLEGQGKSRAPSTVKGRLYAIRKVRRSRAIRPR